MSTKVRVNLREMYPKYYNQDCFVEVDQDVYETMNKYDHIDAVYKRKVDYHKGYFSLDRSPFLELEKEGFDVNENILLKELISFIELTIKDLPVKEKERILKNVNNISFSTVFGQNSHNPEREYPPLSCNDIHNNPVKAGLTKSAEYLEFSSFRDICDMRNGKLKSRERKNESGLIPSI